LIEIVRLRTHYCVPFLFVSLLNTLSSGVCYEHGIGVTKDLAEASRLYLLAAEQGHVDAKKCLESLPLPSVVAPSVPLSEAQTEKPARTGFFSRLFRRGGGGEAISTGEKEQAVVPDRMMTIADFDLLRVICKGQISKVCKAMDG
jgi:TPR repeat protein